MNAEMAEKNYLYSQSKVLIHKEQELHALRKQYKRLGRRLEENHKLIEKLKQDNKFLKVFTNTRYINGTFMHDCTVTVLANARPL